jgi:ATP-dependent helicase/nuclease subunit B
LSGFSPQLTLEAAILGQVGMAGWPAREVCELLYIKLTGGTEPGKENLIRPGDGGVPSIGDLAAHHLTGLRELLDAYRARRRGFTSRPFPVHAPTFSDYDHLARVAEWADEGASEAEAE